MTSESAASQPPPPPVVIRPENKNSLSLAAKRAALKGTIGIFRHPAINKLFTLDGKPDVLVEQIWGKSGEPISDTQIDDLLKMTSDAGIGVAEQVMYAGRMIINTLITKTQAK